MPEARLKIAGMTCASCSARVEHALAEVPGVEQVSVNLALGEAKVTGRGHLPLLGLLEAVHRSGYEAEPLLGEEGRSLRDWTPEEDPALKGDLRLSIALSLPLMALAMLGPAGLGWRIVQGVLATVVVLGPGGRFFRKAWRLLRHKSAAMETLIALGVGAAWLSSAVALLTGGHVYFESAAMIVTLIILGRVLEGGAKSRAADALKALSRLMPERAIVLGEDGEERELPIGELAPADRVRVRAGAKVPADGVVIQGSGSVDESLITGESRLLRVEQGARLVGGSILHDGSLLLRVTAVGEQSALAGIVRLVREAQASKAPVQRLADRVASIFVPVVLSLALVTVAAYLIFVPRVGVLDILMRGVAVLIIACPCALGLATPTAILVGSGLAARHGILFRDASSLERLQAIRLLAMDKTGTLTRGTPSVARYIPFGGAPQDRIFRFVAAAEASVSHPLARALQEYCRQRSEGTAFALAVVARPGGGVQAEIGGNRVLVGAPWYLAGEGISLDEAANSIAELEEAGLSPVLAAIEGRLVAVFGLEDQLRPEVPALIQRIEEMGIETLLLSGDRPEAVRRSAAQAGIASFQAALKPEDKARRIREKSGSGIHVAMLGDGVNDAPALAAADVGIALASGTDVAVATAPVVLVHGNLARVIDAILVSKRTLRTIRQNLFWAFVYNVLAIPLAALGVLNPMIAAGTMAASSVFVVSNSLRLRGFGFRSGAESSR